MEGNTPAELLGLPSIEVLPMTTEDFIPLFAPSGPEDLDPSGHLQLPGPIEAALAPAMAPSSLGFAAVAEIAPAPAFAASVPAPASEVAPAPVPAPDADPQVRHILSQDCYITFHIGILHNHIKGHVKPLLGVELRLT